MLNRGRMLTREGPNDVVTNAGWSVASRDLAQRSSKSLRQARKETRSDQSDSQREEAGSSGDSQQRKDCKARRISGALMWWKVALSAPAVAALRRFTTIDAGAQIMAGPSKNSNWSRNRLPTSELLAFTARASARDSLHEQGWGDSPVGSCDGRVGCTCSAWRCVCLRG